MTWPIISKGDLFVRYRNGQGNQLFKVSLKSIKKPISSRGGIIAVEIVESQFYAFKSKSNTTFDFYVCWNSNKTCIEILAIEGEWTIMKNMQKKCIIHPIVRLRIQEIWKYGL